MSSDTVGKTVTPVTKDRSSNPIHPFRELFFNKLQTDSKNICLYS